MKISLNWLQEFVDIPWSVEETAENLTTLGFPVEGIIKTGIPSDKIIAVKIKAVSKHPNADRLQIATIFNGKEEKQIVCGAPNIAPNQIVPLAIPGAKLTPEFEIKISKIRGVESHGMLCSERELGISENHEGIMMLPTDSKLGTRVKDLLGDEDVIFDIDITPNRPDTLSHVGIARELCALTGKKIKTPKTSWRKSSKGPACKISIKEPKLCHRYLGKIFSNIKVGSSPTWMVQRLNTCGIRSINNIVDITNYVLLEWGHPLHAFDLEKLKNGEILVRKAKNAESLLALDGKKYTLRPSDLVIADGKEPVAIAGIMGGELTGVTESSSNILLESAVFDRTTVRNTSKRLNLKSESSYRFERGTDADTAQNASLRAAQLIMELAQGKPGQARDAYPTKHKSKSVTLRQDRLIQIMGDDIPLKKAEKILVNLGFTPKKVKTSLKCSIPPYRKDIFEEADLIEEVIRVIGYDAIPETLPSINPGIIPETQVPLELLKLTQTLKGLGINETMTSSFSPEDAGSTFGISESQLIHLLNPLSQEESIMRPLLLPNLLNAVQRNIHFQRDQVQLFEIGKKYIKNDSKGSEEYQTISMVLYGQSSQGHWQSKDKPVDFYYLKGIIERLNEIEATQLQLRFNENPPVYYHPKQSFQLIQRGKPCGWAGLIHPSLTEKYDLKHPCAVAEWTLESIRFPKKIVTPIPKYPTVQRDLSVIVEQSTTWEKIEKTVRESEKEILDGIQPFDVFSGGSMDVSKKSIAFRIVLRHSDHTLSEKEINSTMERIKEALKNRCGADIRS